jgi:hypothetical protein
MRRKERLAFVRRALLLEGLERRSMLSGMSGGSPWQNPLDAADLNCDGTVSPSDALAVINAINGGVSIDASSKMAPPQLQGDFETADTDFLDANGDGHLSPSDALAVINTINANGGQPASDVTIPDQPGTPGPDAEVIDLTQGFGRARGVISDANDVDVFQTAPIKSEMNVALFSRGGGAVSVTIVDTDGNTLGSAAIDAGSHRPAKVDLQVETGKTYYLEVKGDVGPYALGVLNFEPDDFSAHTDSPLGTDIHGDTIATAGALVLNQGHARVISNIDSAGDADVFAVTADVDGKLVVEADGEIPLTVDVSDTNGSLAKINTTDHHVIVVNATAGSTYYVSVTAANGTDTGAYQLNVVNAPARAPGDDDGQPEDGHGGLTPQVLFGKIDANGDGSITLVEFEDAVPGQHNQVADQIFASWDTDKSGTLSMNEFVAGLQTLPPVLPHQGDAGPGPAGPLGTGD